MMMAHNFFLDQYKQQRAAATKPACDAPFKSLYFGHSGYVLPCCHNKPFYLGKYPEQSIAEIWGATRAAHLRQALQNFDFSNGCGGCMNQLTACNGFSSHIDAYNHLPSNVNGMPTEFQFELSNICNLECVMCNGNFSSLIRTKREGKPLRKEVYDQNFVPQLIPFLPTLKQAQFYGGEPFLITIYHQIWDAIALHNPAIQIKVQTNGTVLNTKLKEKLLQCNFSIGLSIDSPVKQTYETIRVNAGFDELCQNVQWFVNYCKQKNTYCNISYCVMQQNVHEIAAMAQWCNRLQVPLTLQPVITPYKISVRGIATAQLQHIKNHLQQELKNLPTQGHIESQNYLECENYIQQLDTYLNHSIAQPLHTNTLPIDNLFDFIKLLETELNAAFSLEQTRHCLHIYKQAVAGLEYNPEIIEKYRHYNIYNKENLIEFVSAVSQNTPEHLRYLITEVMH